MPRSARAALRRQRHKNPHNQIFAVAIQLGAVGAVVLLAMWIAHFMLFTGGGLVAWIGMTVVADNFLSSLFNSHLFDTGQGWLYIFGVGVAGGMVLRAAQSVPARLERARPVRFRCRAPAASRRR